MFTRPTSAAIVAALALALGGPATADEHAATDGAPTDPLAAGRRIRGDEAPGYVAFTFDDGPSYKTTPTVLAALERYDVPAAFFVVGRRFAGERGEASANAAVLDDIVRRGHLVGNHTFNHQNLRTVDGATARAAIDRNGKAIAARLGRAPVLFRPPYGQMSGGARRLVTAAGYTEVAWSIDPFDFRRKKDLASRVLTMLTARGGGVVLMHDTKPWTARQLAEVLDALEAENCARKAAGTPLLLPVSLHYFARDKDGGRRPIPAAAASRTASYVTALDARCAAREARVDKASDAD